MYVCVCMCVLMSRLDGEGNIKVSDFGLSEDIYVTGWFRQTESRAIRLPFKWMALESIVDGLFSERSDVVRMKQPASCLVPTIIIMVRCRRL